MESQTATQFTTPSITSGPTRIRAQNHTSPQARSTHVGCAGHDLTWRPRRAAKQQKEINEQIHSIQFGATNLFMELPNEVYASVSSICLSSEGSCKHTGAGCPEDSDQGHLTDIDGNSSHVFQISDSAGIHHSGEEVNVKDSIDPKEGSIDIKASSPLHAFCLNRDIISRHMCFSSLKRAVSHGPPHGQIGEKETQHNKREEAEEGNNEAAKPTEDNKEVPAIRLDKLPNQNIEMIVHGPNYFRKLANRQPSLGELFTYNPGGMVASFPSLSALVGRTPGGGMETASSDVMSRYSEYDNVVQHRSTNIRANTPALHPESESESLSECHSIELDSQCDSATDTSAAKGTVEGKDKSSRTTNTNTKRANPTTEGQEDTKGADKDMNDVNFIMNIITSSKLMFQKTPKPDKENEENEETEATESQGMSAGEGGGHRDSALRQTPTPSVPTKKRHKERSRCSLVTSLVFKVVFGVALFPLTLSFLYIKSQMHHSPKTPFEHVVLIACGVIAVVKAYFTVSFALVPYTKNMFPHVKDVDFQDAISMLKDLLFPAKEAGSALFIDELLRFLEKLKDNPFTHWVNGRQAGWGFIPSLVPSLGASIVGLLLTFLVVLAVNAVIVQLTHFYQRGMHSAKKCCCFRVSVSLFVPYVYEIIGFVLILAILYFSAVNPWCLGVKQMDVTKSSEDAIEFWTRFNSSYTYLTESIGSSNSWDTLLSIFKVIGDIWVVVLVLVPIILLLYMLLSFDVLILRSVFIFLTPMVYVIAKLFAVGAVLVKRSFVSLRTRKCRFVLLVVPSVFASVLMSVIAVLIFVVFVPVVILVPLVLLLLVAIVSSVSGFSNDFTMWYLFKADKFTEYLRYRSITGLLKSKLFLTIPFMAPVGLVMEVFNNPSLPLAIQYCKSGRITKHKIVLTYVCGGLYIVSFFNLCWMLVTIKLPEDLYNTSMNLMFCLCIILRAIYNFNTGNILSINDQIVLLDIYPKVKHGVFDWLYTIITVKLYSIDEVCLKKRCHSKHFYRIYEVFACLGGKEEEFDRTVKENATKFNNKNKTTDQEIGETDATIISMNIVDPYINTK